MGTKNKVMREHGMKKYVGLILLLVLGLTLLGGCGRQSGESSAIKVRTGQALQKEESDIEDSDKSEVIIEDNDVYILEELNMAEETLALYNVSSKKQVKYGYSLTTRFLDKYGDSASWAQFSPGDAVVIGDFYPATKAVTTVQKSDGVWTYDDVTNFSIDKDRNIFKMGDSNYQLSASTKVYSDSAKILLSDITENDVLKVVGQDKSIIAIAVTTGHGYMELKNTDLFDDSLIFIGNKIVTRVYSGEKIEVPEGTYKVTVANDGWGGTAEFTVERDATTTVDLETMKGQGPSYCQLTFEVTVPDTYVYLDGKQVDTSKAVSVRYGSHKLVVDCEGYTSWAKTLVVNSSSATITLNMDEQREDTNTTSTTGAASDENSAIGAKDTATSDTGTSKDKDKADSTTTDSQVDYLSTIADLISKLSN